ncbi:MAG: TIGR00303 family protein [Archaeoglobaceae archaeon]|nr:TIGR00303 family protein [Archaeoglobaceae archaeon]MDW8128023.1 TIGR00303 family protein [Archaeoglobaceae archaeon]
MSKILDLVNGRVLFTLVIGNTRTAEVPGITVAGANPELVKYTPPADAELLYHGKCLSISSVPATPDGKPTPALISYTALRLTKIPILVVDSGLMVKPKIPHLTLHAPVGGNISIERAMSIEDVRRVIENGKILGEQLSKLADLVIIGESIPAGTTTAGAVLRALGFEPRVSSSMPTNPIELKRKVIEDAVKRVQSKDPIEIISAVGDPVIAGVLGILSGCRKALLAGGTQMVAIANLAKRMLECEIEIATTEFVAKDKSADLSLAPCKVHVAEIPLKNSKYPGLRAYAEGFVKEGVGAGGLSFLAYQRGISKEKLLTEIEKDYERIVLGMS